MDKDSDQRDYNNSQVNTRTAALTVVCYRYPLLKTVSLYDREQSPGFRDVASRLYYEPGIGNKSVFAESDPHGTQRGIRRRYFLLERCYTWGRPWIIIDLEQQCAETGRGNSSSQQNAEIKKFR